MLTGTDQGQFAFFGRGAVCLFGCLFLEEMLTKYRNIATWLENDFAWDCVDEYFCDFIAIVVLLVSLGHVRTKCHFDQHRNSAGWWLSW